MSRLALQAPKSEAPALRLGSMRTAAGPSSLRISDQDDSFEREADRAADAVMGDARTADWSLSRMGIDAPLSRKCACGGSADATGDCEECKQKSGSRLQRRAVDGATPDEVPAEVHEVLRSPGRPLDAETRGFMEPRFQHDFSGIRLHTGSREAESARAVNALAYTVGRDIVLGSASPSPTTAQGRRLLAHELAHTIQQSGAPALQRVTADPSAKPKDMTCAPDTGPPGNAELSLTEVSLKGLTPKQKGQIRDYKKRWAADGSKDFIAVDGYASPDSAHDSAGQQKDNWTSSCWRAELVQAQLVHLGVPRSRIIPFAHGETDQFGPQAGPNQRVDIRRVTVQGAGPAPAQSTGVQGPSGFKVAGAGDATQTKVSVTPSGTTDLKTTEPTPPATTSEAQEEGERMFSITLEFDLKNDWKSPAPPTSTGPNPTFACDHGVLQIGAKWNNGLRIIKDRLELFNEPELDVNVAPAFCGGNVGVTAQVNLVKFTILKKLLEADLVPVLGLPDGWASGLARFPFTGGGQVKLDFTPFARLSSDFDNLHVGIFGGLSFEQGVAVQGTSGEKGTFVKTVGGFISLDYDVGPRKKKEKQ